MNNTEMLNAWETRKTAYANQWQTGLCGAPCADPACCCVAMCCPYCTSYSLRKRALYGDMSNYRCCNGFLPCSGRCGESSCPEFCLCCEVCLCFATSVAVTRWMLQDELRIMNSACDNCLLATMVCLQQLACLCQIAAYIVWCSVCACMQTQQKIQLDIRDRSNAGGQGQNYPSPVLQAPVQQQNPMYDRPVGTGAYPPQPGYPPPGYGGAQPGVYPPPGYPQPGYPPQQMYR